jgi:hypothetical protein
MLRQAADMELSDPRIDVTINTQYSHTCFSRAVKAEIDRIKLSVEHQTPSEWHRNGSVRDTTDEPGQLPASVEAMLEAMRESNAVADAEEA